MKSAHATLAARALDDVGVTIEAHVFATPRVFGWVTGATYDNWLAVSKRVNVTRYNHRRDPVQHLPPGLLGFSHVGHQVDFGNIGFPDFAKYHDPETYAKELDKIE